MPNDNPEPSSQDDYRDSIISPRSHIALIICIFLLALGANEWLYLNAVKYFGSDAHKSEYAAAGTTFVVLLIAFFIRPLVKAIKGRRHSVTIVGSIESFRHVSPVNFVFSIIFGVSIAIMAMSQVDWKTKLLGLLTIYLIPGAILHSRHVPINLAFEGSYDKALRVQRLIRFLPDCGKILEGWILIEAGRYTEARKVLIKRAFDAKQRPITFSFHLVLYGYALAAEGLLDEAIGVFESGYRAANGFGNYEMELASCLLAKGIDAERAKRLIEETITAFVFNRDADRVHAIALHAFALAANGLLDQAKSRLQEVFANFAGLKARDQAFLHLIMGATYQASGEKNPARQAFHEAIALHPFGDVKLRAEKWLKLLDEESNSSI